MAPARPQPDVSGAAHPADMNDTPARRGHRVKGPPPASRPAHPEHRATGASLIAVICIGVTFVGIMVLHGVRSDLDPLHDVICTG